MLKSNSRLLLAYGCLLWALSQGAQADVNVTIRGVVVAPPSCSINRGTTLAVDFGDNLMTTRINGVNYRKTVPYTLTCTGLPSNGMTLRFTGTGAAFDSTALATSKSDLGIKLYINSAGWGLNTAVRFTYPTLPRVEAVPIKKPGVTLTGGAFTAVATLVAVVQ